MDHLFLENMVKEKVAAFERETGVAVRLSHPDKRRTFPLTARMSEWLGNALIRLGRYLKERYGLPHPELLSVRACPSNSRCSRPPYCHQSR